MTTPRTTRADAAATMVVPSLLERLRPESDADGRGNLRVSKEDAIALVSESVQADLSWLMNTRQLPLEIGEHFTELNQSVIRYGIPDTTSLGRHDPSARRRLQRWIEDAVSLFEPRLRDVRVELVAPTETGGGRIRFVIRGILTVDARPVKIAFDGNVDEMGTVHVLNGPADAR